MRQVSNNVLILFLVRTKQIHHMLCSRWDCRKEGSNHTYIKYNCVRGNDEAIGEKRISRKTGRCSRHVAGAGQKSYIMIHPSWAMPGRTRDVFPPVPGLPFVDHHLGSPAPLPPPTSSSNTSAGWSELGPKVLLDLTFLLSLALLTASTVCHE